MPKQVGNTACVLAYHFNSASRQFCEVLASQFPFLHSVHDTVPPSEAALMVTSAGLWHRVTNNHHLDCPSL